MLAEARQSEARTARALDKSNKDGIPRLAERKRLTEKKTDLSAKGFGVHQSTAAAAHLPASCIECIGVVHWGVAFEDGQYVGRTLLILLVYSTVFTISYKSSPPWSVRFQCSAVQAVKRVRMYARSSHIDPLAEKEDEKKAKRSNEETAKRPVINAAARVRVLIL